MSTLDKQFGFYAFLSAESDMIGNPIRYDLGSGFVPDLTEKVSYDVARINDVLRSKKSLGDKWQNVVMLDTLKRSVIVKYESSESKFVPIGKLEDLLPADFFKESDGLADPVRADKKRYDDYVELQIKLNQQNQRAAEEVK